MRAKDQQPVHDLDRHRENDGVAWLIVGLALLWLMFLLFDIYSVVMDTDGEYPFGVEGGGFLYSSEFVYLTVQSCTAATQIVSIGLALLGMRRVVYLGGAIALFVISAVASLLISGCP